jgi:hypothetical protein
VVVVVEKASERVDVELRWAGGLAESQVLGLPVKRYDLWSDHPRLVASLRPWSSEGLSAAAIAGRLNAEGFRPPKRVERFNRGMVQRLLVRLGWPTANPTEPGLAWWGTNTARAAWQAGSGSHWIR